MSTNQVSDLIEFKRIEQFVKLSVLSVLLELDIVLLESVECQLGLIVNENFERLKAKSAFRLS
jgi:hypothetical protein